MPLIGAYWFSPLSIAARVKSKIRASGSNPGKPCAKLIASWELASAVITEKMLSPVLPNLLRIMSSWIHKYRLWYPLTFDLYRLQYLRHHAYLAQILPYYIHLSNWDGVAELQLQKRHGS